MAIPQKWLYAAIEAAAGCQAYPVEAPDLASPPYVIFTRSATARELVLADTLDDDPQPDTFPPVATFDLSIYADGYLAAWTVADAIRGELHRIAGTAHDVAIESCLLVDEADGEPVFYDGRETPTYVISQTYQVRYTD
jgi:hypothetical protein